jgi:hypothetical protein
LSLIATDSEGINLSLVGDAPPIWLDDHTFVFVAGNALGRFDVPAITRYDLEARTAEILHIGSYASEHKLVYYALLPGKQYLDVARRLGPSDPNAGELGERLLLDIRDGSLTPLDLPSEEDEGGRWLTDRWYLYARNSGGLAGVGTWLYDREDDTSRRVCHESALTQLGNGLSNMGREAVAVYMETSGYVFFIGGDSGHPGFRFALDGGECEPAEDLSGYSGGDFLRINPEPVDLGFGGATETGAAGPRPDAPSRLDDVYPNPGSANVTFRFHLRSASEVSLVVYDILGRAVETLTSGHQPPGVFEYGWDASGQASGVYFYRLTTGMQQMTKTLVLTR